MVREEKLSVNYDLYVLRSELTVVRGCARKEEGFVMALDLSSLQKGVESLTRAIAVGHTCIKENDDTDQAEVIRAGIIQNFEFTYELCWKFMQRWLEVNAVGEAVDRLTMKELFRIAAERHLIKNVEAWFEYHKARNKTSHIYNIAIAKDVYRVAELFLVDAKALLKELEDRND